MKKTLLLGIVVLLLSFNESFGSNKSENHTLKSEKSFGVKTKKQESKLKKRSKIKVTPPSLCSDYYYLTCVNCWGEEIVVAGYDFVYWCDTGVLHHVTETESGEDCNYNCG